MRSVLAMVVLLVGCADAESEPDPDAPEEAWGLELSAIDIGGSEPVYSDSVLFFLTFSAQIWAPESCADCPVFLGVWWDDGEGAGCADVGVVGEAPGEPFNFGSFFPGPRDVGSHDLSAGLFSEEVCSNPEDALASEQMGSVTASEPPPLDVLATTPADGAVDVGIDARLSITFGEAVAAASLGQSTFRVVGPSDAQVATAILTADTVDLGDVVLDDGVTYTVTVEPGLRSDSGLRLDSAYSWSFATAPR
ncbi:MAG: Ig-like domain-containing protein [Proteobacteria bacterium]|nr:Ig-like domain-containing protein [Pseudomonadota bacterium]